MSIENVKPAETYELLVKQFYALKSLAIARGTIISSMSREKWMEDNARRKLDSERMANEILTAELEELKSVVLLLRSAIKRLSADEAGPRKRSDRAS